MTGSLTFCSLFEQNGDKEARSASILVFERALIYLYSSSAQRAFTVVAGSRLSYSSDVGCSARFIGIGQIRDESQRDNLYHRIHEFQNS